MKLYIKNMVCDRCVMVVRNVLDGLHIDYEEVILGEVLLKSDISDSQKIQLSSELSQLGFEMIDDRKSRLVERIKIIMIQTESL